MVSINENKDFTLVGQCLSGSEPAWMEFYSRFERLVRMVVRRRLHNSEDATEDVVHDVFITLLSALKNYNSSYSLQNFVQPICPDCVLGRNACLQILILESERIVSLSVFIWLSIQPRCFFNTSRTEDEIFHLLEGASMSINVSVTMTRR